jgi:hypothetical protein
MRRVEGEQSVGVQLPDAFIPNSVGSRFEL